MSWVITLILSPAAAGDGQTIPLSPPTRPQHSILMAFKTFYESGKTILSFSLSRIPFIRCLSSHSHYSWCSRTKKYTRLKSRSSDWCMKGLMGFPSTWKPRKVPDFFFFLCPVSGQAWPGVHQVGDPPSQPPGRRRPPPKHTSGDAPRSHWPLPPLSVHNDSLDCIMSPWLREWCSLGSVVGG